MIALNEGEHLRSTIENIEATMPAHTEILVVDDGSEDGSTAFLESARHSARLVRSDHLGVAKARNWGASQTTGEVIIFADAHITLPENWWEPLVDVLADKKAGAASPAIYDLSDAGKKGFGLYLSGPSLEAKWLDRQDHKPHPAPILPGCCVAMRRDAFLETGGFDSGLLSRGGVDNEMGVRFWLLGYELIVVPEVSVGHLFRKQSPYPVMWSTYLHNCMRLAFLHLGQTRAFKVLEALKSNGAFNAALLLAIESDVTQRRAELRSKRVHDDDWLFERFQMQW